MTAFTVLPDPEAAARHVAAQVPARGHVALAGGTSPRRAYELAEPGEAEFWLVDERCVPNDHPESNGLMLRQSLGEGAHVRAARGELGPEDAAWLYARELVAALGDEPVFDLVVLGLGPDGHIASLFPDHPEAWSRHAPVIAIRRSPKPPPERITLTLPVIARARHTVLLVTGDGKREALARVCARDEALPVSALGDGLDEIVCDRAAAG
ncbi:MAG TPA: 6-phosphogluconolactonase [Solirubrobacteraceae bacterium]